MAERTGQDRSARRTRPLLWLAWALLAVILAAGGALAYLFSHPQALAPRLEALFAPPGGRASLEVAALDLWPPRLFLKNLQARDRSPEGPGWEARELDLTLDPWGFLRGRPLLANIRVEGLVLDLRLDRNRASEGEEAALDLEALAWLFRVDRASLTGCRVRVRGGGWELAGEDLSLSLEPLEKAGEGSREVVLSGRPALLLDGRPALEAALTGRGSLSPGPRLALQLRLEGIEADHPLFRGRGSARAAILLDRENLAIDGFRLDMAEAAPWPGAPDSPFPLPAGLGLEFKTPLRGGPAVLTISELFVGDLFRASGNLRGPGWGSLEGSLTGRARGLSRIWPLVRDRLPRDLAGWEPRGALDLEAGLTPGSGFQGMSLVAKLDGLSLARAGWGLGLEPAGVLTLARKAGEAWGLAGDLSGQASWRSGDWALEPARLEARLEGDPLRPSSPYIRLSIPRGGLKRRGVSPGLGEASLAARLAWREDVPLLEGLDLRLPGLPPLTGELTFPPEGPAGRLEMEGAELAASLEQAALLWPGALAGWKAGGRASLRLRREPGGPLEAGLRLAAGEGGSPDGTWMASDLEAGLSLEARPGPPWAPSLKLSVNKGQVLAGTVFLDLGQHPLAFSAAGEVPGWTDLRKLKLDLTLGRMLRAGASGNILRKNGRWAHRGGITLSGADLGPLFNTFVRDPLAPAYPQLSGLALSGRGSLELSSRGEGGRSDLAGRLKLTGVDLRDSGNDMDLKGLDLDLPLAYRLGGEPPGEPAAPGPGRWGRLALAGFRAGGLDLGPLESPAALVPNRLLIPWRVSLSFWDGRVELGSLTVDRPLSGDFRAAASLEVRDLDLGRVSAGYVRLSGRLSGRLDPVALESGLLEARGSLKGRLFGGGLELTRLKVAQPFLPGRAYGGDLNLQEASLEELSTALGAGLITGRVDVALKDFLLAYGQPQSFDLTVRSVPVDGVSQRVSLKAVNSISVLGTGAGLSGMGVRMLTALVDSFPYENLGFRCTLANDVFTLRGLIHEDGVEYLVKKPPLMGINVINRNPDNRILFSDMVERLERIGAPQPGREPAPEQDKE